MSASREKKLRKQQGVTGSSKEEKTGLTGFQKAVITVVSIVVALFVILVIVLNSGLIQQITTAVTVGTEKISVAEYSYYYMDTVNSTITMYEQLGYSASDLGIDTSLPYNQQPYTTGSGTWDDQFKNQTNTTLQTVFSYYLEAKNAGYEMTEEDYNDVEEQINSLKSYCTENGIAFATYLRSVYGKGVGENELRTFLQRRQLAESYQSYLSDQRTYTDEDLETYYEENKDSIDVVDYRAFSIDGSNQTEHEEGYEYAEGEEEAEAEAAMEAARTRANEALAALDGLDSFTEVASTYCDAEDAETYADPSASTYTNVQYSTLVSTLADWLFDSARVQGDSAVLESGTDVVVIMFDQRYREEYLLKNVRHILVQDEDETPTEEMTDEEKAALKQEAEDLLAQWKAGEATEESFATMADEYSADTAVEGGLYENIYVGQMVDNFNDWIFDASRQPGDTGIVESTYGYHIIYFVGDGEVSWKTDVTTYLEKEASSAESTEFSEAHPLTTSTFGLSMIGG